MDMVTQDNMQHDAMRLANSDGSSKPSGFATTSEAATFLRLSKAMIHKLIGEGSMPACRYGRAVRIPWAWLRDQAGA